MLTTSPHRYQNFPDTTACDADPTDRCDYKVMAKDKHDALAGEFSFDTKIYMSQTVDCAELGGTAGRPDLYVC